MLSEGVGPFYGFVDVVPGGGLSVLGPEGAAGAGVGRSRGTGWACQVRAEVPKPSPNSGGGEAAGLGGPLPGAPEVRSGSAEEPELGVGGDDEPGPAVCGLGTAELGAGPAERRLDHPEGVLKIEAAQECLPADVDIRAGQTRLGGPQSDRNRGSVARQVVDFEPDQRAVEYGEFAVVVDPRGQVPQPWMDVIPGHGPGESVAFVA